MIPGVPLTPCAPLSSNSNKVLYDGGGDASAQPWLSADSTPLHQRCCISSPFAQICSTLVIIIIQKVLIPGGHNYSCPWSMLYWVWAGAKYAKVPDYLCNAVKTCVFFFFVFFLYLGDDTFLAASSHSHTHSWEGWSDQVSHPKQGECKLSVFIPLISNSKKKPSAHTVVEKCKLMQQMVP